MKPILVTGAPRSGTTWMGKMLTLSKQLHYVHEPFNPDHPLDDCISEIKFSHYMMYITEEIEDYKKKYYKPFKRLMEGKCGPMEGLNTCRSFKDLLRVHKKQKEFIRYYKQGMLPLIKDPIALMSAGWLARTFDIHVAVMIRHPAAVVASMKRLKWSFDPRNWALSQPLLIRDYLAPYEAELIDIVKNNADVIDRLALLWKIVYHVVLRYKEQNPDWLYIRHEDIAVEPAPYFAKLYRKFGLNFSEGIKGKIDEYTDAKNPTISEKGKKEIKRNSKNLVGYWRHTLSSDEIRKIRRKVEEVSSQLYQDEDWQISKRSATLEQV